MYYPLVKTSISRKWEILTTAGTPFSSAAGAPTAVSARLYALEQEDEFQTINDRPSKLNIIKC